jgi:hypothetical protein
VIQGTPVQTSTVIENLEFDLNPGNSVIENAFPPEEVAVTLRNIKVVGGYQTLDGMGWQDVTFIGTAIRYYGGPVELKNVRFINCTFLSPPVPTATQFLDYAALGLTNLSIKTVG